MFKIPEEVLAPKHRRTDVVANWPKYQPNKSQVQLSVAGVRKKIMKGPKIYASWSYEFGIKSQIA
jgi:hypothetical protein